MTPQTMTAAETATLPARPEAGFGALATERGHLPLEAMDVHATLLGLLSTTTVVQRFANAFTVPLEATYIFPLPDRAAVTAFRLEVAGRVVAGALLERDKARRTYEDALAAGHRAAIAEEERPGTFTMRVGNIPSGEHATVRLELTGPLAVEGADATFRFPLVVAPRYIPGAPLPGLGVGTGTAPDTDAVPDASRITPPVLLPGFPNPVELSLGVDVEPGGLGIVDLRSSLHLVDKEDQGKGWQVRLRPGERLDRDFVLRFRLADDTLHAALVAAADPDGAEGSFSLTIVPPPAAGSRPRDVALVIDRSGSMGGWKMLAARRAAARIVDALDATDRIAVLAFDTTVETPGTGLLSATDPNRFRAVEFLTRLDARGGTEMAAPLLDAARLFAGDADPGRDRVLVLVTDGQIGNEDQLLAALAPVLGATRVFAVGIDQAVNEGFLRRLAILGGGTCELVESEARLDEVLDRIHRQIKTPALTDVAVSSAGLDVIPGTLAPEPVRAVFDGSPLVIYGRHRGAAGGAVEVRGTRADGTAWSARIAANAVDGPAATAISSAWARGRVRALEDRYVTSGHPEALEREIVATSLRFGVLCRFTAFVAVDVNERIEADGRLHRVTQPVEVPAGWEMAPAEAPILFAAMPASLSRFSLDAAAGPTSRMSPAAPVGARLGKARYVARSQPVPALDVTGLRRRAKALAENPPATLAGLTREIERLLTDVQRAGAAEATWRPLADLLVRLRAAAEPEATLEADARTVLAEFAEGPRRARRRFWATPPRRPTV